MQSIRGDDNHITSTISSALADYEMSVIHSGPTLTDLYQYLTFPFSQVVRGQIQSPNLGMALASYSPLGKFVPIGEPGDLVCTKPFPCMPVFFWGDDEKKTRYRSSYFAEWGGRVWVHGDWCKS